MFLGILNWMLSHVPSFMRPGVNWLVDGLRKITGHIAAIWNTLGTAAGVLLNAIAHWQSRMASFVVAVGNAFWWLRNVWLPAQLNALLYTIIGLINGATALVYNTVMAAVLAVERWTSALVAELSRFVVGVRDWAMHQLARVDAFLDGLVRALRHVMSGPDALAEWLVGALFYAALRRLYTERDRIFNWMFAQSSNFALWVARQLEDMIVRLL